MGSLEGSSLLFLVILIRSLKENNELLSSREPRFPVIPSFLLKEFPDSSQPYGCSLGTLMPRSQTTNCSPKYNNWFPDYKIHIPVEKIRESPNLSNNSFHKLNLIIVKELIGDGKMSDEEFKLESEKKSLGFIVNTSYIVDLDDHIPSFIIENLSADFKYKKYTRECLEKIFGYRAGDILDIKLWSSNGLNHTYLVILKQNKMKSTSISTSNVKKENTYANGVYKWKHSTQLVRGKEHSFTTRQTLYTYLESTRNPSHTSFYEIDNHTVCPFKVNDIWRELAKFYGSLLKNSSD